MTAAPDPRRRTLLATLILAGVIAGSGALVHREWARGDFDPYPRYFIGHIPDVGDAQIYLCLRDSVRTCVFHPSRHRHTPSPAGTTLRAGAISTPHDFTDLGGVPLDQPLGELLESARRHAEGLLRTGRRYAVVFHEPEVPRRVVRAFVRRLRDAGAQAVFDGEAHPDDPGARQAR